MTAYREAVDFLSRFKYNFLMLEIGGAMEFKSHPEINAGWLEYCEFMNEYSGKPQKIQGSFAWRKNSIHTTNGGGKVVPQSMVREMIEYAEARHFEVVPEMPSLSHCDYLLTRHPELAERPEDPYPDTCCPNHPDYYNLIFDLFDEVIRVFRPNRMHIGHDEYYSVALCPRCRDKNAAEIYADDINKCSEFLKSRGVSTMIWGEKLLDAHYPNGIGCGGAQIDSIEDGHERHIPPVWPSIDKMPADLQVMHWYWSIDRDLEQAFTERDMPVVYGNMSLRNFPEWKRRRQAPNIQGLCISNWGATDFRTLQRNAIFFDLASAAAWSWNDALDSDDYPAIRDWTLRELYFLRREQYGCELIETGAHLRYRKGISTFLRRLFRRRSRRSAWPSYPDRRCGQRVCAAGRLRKQYLQRQRFVRTRADRQNRLQLRRAPPRYAPARSQLRNIARVT